MNVSHRFAEPADRDFIVSSWSSSYRTAYCAGLIDMENYAAVMHAQIERYLDRPDVRAVVAFEADDPAFLYGFAAGDTTPQFERLENGRTREWPALLYYVFVKAPYRRAGYDRGVRVGDGIARGLLVALGIPPSSRFLYACKTRSRRGSATRPRSRSGTRSSRFPKEPRAADEKAG